MRHEMGLYEVPFRSIEQRLKTVEIRLNDPKRQQVQVGDQIQFTHTETSETLLVHVTKRETFQDFQALYEHVSRESIDCVGWSLDELVTSTYAIYSPEAEQQYGALALTIALEP
ncbi:ASCH domain-containing protein [Exiguobacterium sp. ZWU0009]|uniref:ASCH domain-containing protein n=1 Tax=Exiguobacterium sp. ZWU0009 TaxID=1224749 RepID=UPI0006461DA1|nr:ASCH domain-containing protein [Exiguobacterium sp. ZWU0009]HBQ77559.1 ASCH domain-containing protein [Exiguobacterium sp.]